MQMSYSRGLFKPGGIFTPLARLLYLKFIRGSNNFQACEGSYGFFRIVLCHLFLNLMFFETVLRFMETKGREREMAPLVERESLNLKIVGSIPHAEKLSIDIIK